MSIFASISYSDTFPSGTQIVGQVNIIILDSFGNPANGDNCVVNYTQNINGAITTSDVTIAGQSCPIRTGIISDSSTGFFTSFTVNSLTPGTISPDPAVCDLVINSFIITNQSAAGANDGTIQILGYTSNGNTQYSLDNITFQDSPIFTGLPGGAGIAYAKDALGCTATKPYFISTATDLLIQDPSVDLGNGHVSRWNAAFNPVYFIFQRKDFVISGITEAMDGSENILVAVNTDVSTVKKGFDSVINGVNTHTNGDFVYINTPLYEGTYEVLAASVNALMLNCPYNGDDSTGFININRLRPYYQIKSILTYVDPILNKLKTITITNVPLTNGYLMADLSSFLQSLLSTKDYSNYTLINYRDMQLSASYQVKYAEIWDNNTPQWRVLNNPYYVVYAAKQLGDIGGGNLQQYVPYLNGFQPAKWITDFVMPVYNPGFPFDLSFIFSQYMVGLAPYYHITLLDINFNPLTDQSVVDAFLLNEDGSFVLNEDGSKFIIASSDIVNYPIVEHVGLNRLLINFNPPDICWYFKVELKYNGITPAIFNYTLSELTTPEFIDGNIDFQENGHEKQVIIFSGSGQLSYSAGNIYSIQAFCQTTPSGATNPKLNVIVIKDGVPIFQKTVAAVSGASMLKTGIAQPGAIYEVTVTTLDTVTNLTLIDIADTGAVTGDDSDLMQPIICRLDQNTTDRPVYMRWIGLTGSWNYYKFVYNQVKMLEVSDPVIIKNFVINWETEDTIESVLSKNAGRRMQVFGENVPVDDIDAMVALKAGCRAQILTSTNPIKWQTVVVPAGSYTESETMLKQYSFSITFNLPSLNLQTQ